MHLTSFTVTLFDNPLEGLNVATNTLKHFADNGPEHAREKLAELAARQRAILDEFKAIPAKPPEPDQTGNVECHDIR